MTTVNPDISRVRAKLDALDDRLFELIARRYRLSRALQMRKSASGCAPYDFEREAEIVARLCARAKRQGIPDDGFRVLVEALLGLMRSGP